MRSSIFVALSAVSLVSAVKNFTINPASVDSTTRANWCTAQINTCQTLCSDQLEADNCDPDFLTYNCTCSNGSAPGLVYYIQTIPTFICEEAFNECNTANTGNSLGQQNCTKSIRDECGTLDPSNFTAPAASSSSSSSSAPSTTAAATSTGAATAASSTPTTTASKAGAVPTAMAHLGNGAAAVALGLFAYLL